MAAAADRADQPCQAFRGTLGAKVVICKPADPEAKGLVERFHDYLERSFLPGRDFASPADFNAQLQSWLVRANNRHHRRLGCRPVDRIAGDRAAMLPCRRYLRSRAGRDHPPCARPLRSLGRQRLLRTPRSSRQTHRKSGQISTRPSVLCRQARRRTCRVWAKHQTLPTPSTSPRPRRCDVTGYVVRRRPRHRRRGPTTHRLRHLARHQA